MPVIAPHYFNVGYGDSYKERYTYKAVVKVTSQGEFAIEIPDELIPACEELAKSEARVEVIKGKNTTAVHSHDKTLAVALIEKAIRIYATADVSTEIVIVYAHDSEGGYVVGPNGEIAPDGYDVDANFPKTKKTNASLRAGWRWSGEKHNHFGTESVFKFGIGAEVYKKTTMKRKTGTSVKYELYWGEGASHFDRETYCQRLNSFEISFGLSNHGNLEYSHHKEIPYTEEGAKFFFEAMIALCSISERVQAFFADSKSLQKAIENRATLVLGGGD